MAEEKNDALKQTVQEIWDTMNTDQKELCFVLTGKAIIEFADRHGIDLNVEELSHSDLQQVLDMIL